MLLSVISGDRPANNSVYAPLTGGYIKSFTKHLMKRPWPRYSSDWRFPGFMGTLITPLACSRRAYSTPWALFPTLLIQYRSLPDFCAKASVFIISGVAPTFFSAKICPATEETQTTRTVFGGSLSASLVSTPTTRLGMIHCYGSWASHFGCRYQQGREQFR